MKKKKLALLYNYFHTYYHITSSQLSRAQPAQLCMHSTALCSVQMVAGGSADAGSDARGNCANLPGRAALFDKVPVKRGLRTGICTIDASRPSALLHSVGSHAARPCGERWRGGRGAGRCRGARCDVICLPPGSGQQKTFPAPPHSARHAPHGACRAPSP